MHPQLSNLCRNITLQLTCCPSKYARPAVTHTNLYTPGAVHASLPSTSCNRKPSSSGENRSSAQAWAISAKSSGRHGQFQQQIASERADAWTDGEGKRRYCIVSVASTLIYENYGIQLRGNMHPWSAPPPHGTWRLVSFENSEVLLPEHS